LVRKLPEKVGKEGATVRAVIKTLRAMLREEPCHCPYCQSDQLEKGKILPNRKSSSMWLGLGNERTGFYAASVSVGMLLGIGL
jgi:hypothetical protein